MTAADRSWRTSLVLLGGLLAASYGLHAILRGSSWFFELALLCIIVLGAPAVVRMLSRRAWLAPLVGIAAFIVTLTVLFAPGTAFLAVIPTGNTLGAFGHLLEQANNSITVQSLPAKADPGILFLLCVSVGALTIAADLLAVAVALPALAGLPLIVLLAGPPYIEPGSTDPISFLLTAIAYLLLLRVGSRRGQGSLALALGAAVIVVTIALPLALPAVDDSSVEAGNGVGSGVNPVLSLGDDLRQGADRAVLDYSTKSGDSHYLRLVSVDNFSGTNWAPDSFTLNRGNGVDSIATAPGLLSDVKRTKDTTTVRVQQLTTSWLPLPYPTTSVTGLSGSWYWDSEGHAVASTNNSVNGQTYRAADVEIEPTPDQLLAAGTVVPAGLEKYLVVPKGLPAIIGTTARKVVGTAPTNYEKALLLQSYFHDGDFEYSETAPVDRGYDGTGGQVIAKFLQAKSGYCIHFASAMAMMARVLGIPARISVGFLPGSPVSDRNGQRTFEVTSHDLHAWPELYFEGVGWTRFEPTVSRGDVPDYADLADPSVPTPSSSDNPTPSTSAAPGTAPSTAATPVPTGSALPQSAGSASGSAGSIAWLVLAIVVAAVLSLLPGVVRAVERRRRLRRVQQRTVPVLVAWRELLQTSADVGQPVPATLTPREAAAFIAGGAASTDPAFERLLDALEHERFAQTPVAYPGAADDTRAVLAVVRGAVQPRTRVVAVLYPRSIWRRVLRLGAADS
jgi:transglutaminase-like putative cysteine protease